MRPRKRWFFATQIYQGEALGMGIGCLVSHHFLNSRHMRYYYYFILSIIVSADIFPVVIAARGKSGVGATGTTMATNQEEQSTIDETSMYAVNEEDTEWGCAIESPLNEASKIISNDGDKQCEADIDDTDIEEDVDVAIVGGGLAGLAVAIGLSRNGISCKIYERAPALRSLSQGILAVQANGMKALESIDPSIPNLVEKAGCERRVFIKTNIREDGSISETSDESDWKEYFEKHGRFKIGLTWHRMQQVLASLVPDNIVVTNRSLQSFTELDNSVLLHFASGDTVRAKAVIACDGVFSVARRQIAPHDDAPIFFGQLNWGTIIETDKLPPGMHPKNAVRYIHHEGDPRWMSMLNDGGSGYTFWQFRLAKQEIAMTLSGNNGRGGLGLKGSKERLLPIAKSCPDVFRTIANIPEEQIFERSIVSRHPLNTWRSKGGLVALVGDSAHGMHPNIAQGANSSFESAAAIVHALTNAKKGPKDSVDDDYNWRRTALENFESARKPRADIVQRFANLMGVNQATGITTEELSISRSQIKNLMEWIAFSKDPKPKNEADGDDDIVLDHDMVETLMKSDPCNYPGISKLW